MKIDRLHINSPRIVTREYSLPELFRSLLFIFTCGVSKIVEMAAYIGSYNVRKSCRGSGAE